MSMQLKNPITLEAALSYLEEERQDYYQSITKKERQVKLAKVIASFVGPELKNMSPTILEFVENQYDSISPHLNAQPVEILV